MKTTIFALSLAAVAAMASVSGASATFYSNGDYFRPSFKTIEDSTTAYRIDRHYTDTPDYRWHKSGDWNKRSWYANRGWCSSHPDSWRCQSGSR
jgi:hypothetical protein